MDIERLDHLVLTVRNVARTCAFYRGVLGMEEITFRGSRRGLRFGTQKINLHEQGNEFEPKAAVPMPGSADLCFITETPLSECMARCRARAIEIVEGPVRRAGACGAIESFYVRDPDGNLIEISRYVDDETPDE